MYLTPHVTGVGLNMPSHEQMVIILQTAFSNTSFWWKLWFYTHFTEVCPYASNMQYVTISVGNRMRHIDSPGQYILTKGSAGHLIAIQERINFDDIKIPIIDKRWSSSYASHLPINKTLW